MLLLLLAFPHALLHGQTVRPVAPTFSVGASLFEFDERGPYNGLAVRGGAGVLSYFDVVLIGEHWPNLGSLVGWATQLEASLYPAGRKVIAPRILLGVGRFWASPGEQTTGRGVNGFATSFGLGVQARVWRNLALEFEGLVRYDAHARDVQLRLLMAYASRSSGRPLASPPRVAGVVYGMVTAAGPWHFTEPAYGLRFTTPVTERYAGSLGVALLHWRIPHPSIPGAYAWDTRAVLISPAWQWNRGSRLGELRARVGPALTLMFEGPDDGVRAGAQLEGGATVRAGPLPLTAGVAWFWLNRHRASGNSTTGSDQHGIMLSAGIGF